MADGKLNSVNAGDTKYYHYFSYLKVISEKNSQPVDSLLIYVPLSSLKTLS